MKICLSPFRSVNESRRPFKGITKKTGIEKTNRARCALDRSSASVLVRSVERQFSKTKQKGKTK